MINCNYQQIDCCRLLRASSPLQFNLYFNTNNIYLNDVKCYLFFFWLGANNLFVIILTDLCSICLNLNTSRKLKSDGIGYLLGKPLWVNPMIEEACSGSPLTWTIAISKWLNLIVKQARQQAIFQVPSHPPIAYLAIFSHLDI